MRKLFISACLLAVSATVSSAQTSVSETVHSTVINNKSESVGRIVVRGGKNATVVRITLNAGALTPGWHGLHFHAVGDCSDPEKFEKSKAHVNHTAAKHGLLNAEGPDEGDLPNVFANADGSVNAEVSTATLLAGDKGLKDADGSALVIHANEDDFTSQPIGGAGARVACAVIK